MSDIWWFTSQLPDEPGLDRLGQYCKFTNAEDMFRAWPAAQGPAPSNFPTARLELTLEDFSLDRFCWGAYTRPYTLVSQDLRDAMALEPEDVQYLPVDATLSAPLPRSKNYMIMRVPVVENISDPDQSDYQIKNIVGLPKNLIWPTRIDIRKDAKPTHEIFQDIFFSGYVFCTDRLATRVLQSECSGVRFFDPGHLDNPMLFRSLRGIEEERWDPIQEKFHRKLVRAIP